MKWNPILPDDTDSAQSVTVKTLVMTFSLCSISGLRTPKAYYRKEHQVEVDRKSMPKHIYYPNKSVRAVQESKIKLFLLN